MKTILYKHQIDIIREDRKKAGIFLGTGSGKTLTTLMLASGRTLVVAPKTQVMDGNWIRETKKVGELERRFTIVDVVSKETFRRDWSILDRYDTIIFDEAHTVLGVTPSVRWVKKVPIPKTSQLFEAVISYLEKHKPERVYLVSATIGKSPMTIWAAAKVLGHEWDFFAFREKFYFNYDRNLWIARDAKHLKQRLSEIVNGLGHVGRLHDYFDVPEQTFKTIWIETTKDQDDALKRVKIDFPDPLVQIGKKHQIENGILTGDEFNLLEEFDTEKIAVLKDLAEEFPKMVVFAKYTAQIARIKTELSKEGYKVLVLDGTVSDRESLFKEANKAESCIFIAQSQISAGWELPAFPVMVFASMSTSYVDRVQAEGRILRANHLKKNLYIDLVVRGGIDEAIYDSIKGKKDFNEMIYLQNEQRKI